jgi:DNA-binding MarR family transcriptional regulator
MFSMTENTSDGEYFFLALTEAADRTRSFVDAVQARLGLTGGEYALLRVIERHPDLTAAEAGERLRIKGPSVAEVVARLEKRALIKRLPDPRDARRRKLRLTPEGNRIVRSGRKATMDAIKALRLPPKELASLTRSLRFFLSSLPSHGDE